MATRIEFPRFKAWTSSGNLAVGYKVWTYEAGTSTLLTTYSDNGVTPNTNPVILDSLGEANIFITESAKINLLDTADAQISGFPIDNVDPTTVEHQRFQRQHTLTLLG